MTDIELRDLVFKEFYGISMKPEYRFLKIKEDFMGRNWRYDSDIENDLADEVNRMALESCIRWHDDGFYMFNGKIYVKISEEIVLSAFKIWLSRIGMKLSQKRKYDMFANEYKPNVRIGNRLNIKLSVVAFENGVLDLEDMSFHDFSPEFHVTYYHPYKYDKKAKCPKWQAFLQEVLPEKRSRIILQMFLGLGLIERGTVYNQYEGKERPKIELCLILIGSGANGKSVIYQTAMGLFGKDRISGIDYDELCSQGDEGMRARRLLRDVIFNWSSDSDSKTFGRKRTGVFKRIVSGEPTTDRAIGGNVQQNFRMPYLIFNLNELPYPEDNTLGFIRRLQFISFDITIPASRQNKTLAIDLVGEYSGIFNWVLRGAKEIRRRKFQFPDSTGSRRQMLLAQLRGNPVISWVNAYRVRSLPQAHNEQVEWISAKDVYASLEQFCADNDAPMVSSQKIGQTMSSLHFDKKRTAQGFEYKFYGVGIQDIFRPFIIQNESMFDRLSEENDTCLDIND